MTHNDGCTCRTCRAWERTASYQIDQAKRAWYELLASVLRAMNGLFR